VRDDLLADDIYKSLARDFVITHESIKNVLAYLLAIILVNSMLSDLINRHVSVVTTTESDCYFHERPTHALATFLLKIGIEVVIEGSRSASALNS
jgi:hypothetical protein